MTESEEVKSYIASVGLDDGLNEEVLEEENWMMCSETLLVMKRLKWQSEHCEGLMHR